MGISGAAVYRKTSPLAGRLGERILSPNVTLIDDLRPEAGRAGAPFDDEGIAADRRVLVDAGVLRGYLCDLRHAARLGHVAGRASRAGYASMPFPGSGNQLVEPGEEPLAQLLARAEGGIVVDSLLGMHGSNLANGDFSANVGLGFAVGPGGETLHRVKDVAIAGNVYDLLGDRLESFSVERKWGFGGSELLPWALCSDVALT
jgi:PmbA protein